MEESAPLKTGHTMVIPLLLTAVITILTTIITLHPTTQAQSSPTIAHINGQPITEAHFQTELELQRVKYELTQRNYPVNQAALFNRIIGDTLILQAAAADGYQVEDTLVENEINAILNRFGINRNEMTQILRNHQLDWQVFETSVREYTILTHYLDDVVLANINYADRQNFLQNWMSDQYNNAKMDFDQTFLDRINAPIQIQGTNQ
ncbi:MAG: hypothetical protein D6706_14045 [Chloroflexi bacterium]|nr:MAG: hypothetical protein D6706_14045 [Chloroflexota bacterium]